MVDECNCIGVAVPPPPDHLLAVPLVESVAVTNIPLLQPSPLSPALDLYKIIVT